jgi:hypothetical protein
MPKKMAQSKEVKMEEETKTTESKESGEVKSSESVEVDKDKVGLTEGPAFEPEIDVAEGEFDVTAQAEGTTPSYNPASTDDRGMFVAPGPGSHPDSDIHDYLATEYNDGHPGFVPPKY